MIAYLGILVACWWWWWWWLWCCWWCCCWREGRSIARSSASTGYRVHWIHWVQFLVIAHFRIDRCLHSPVSYCCSKWQRMSRNFFPSCLLFLGIIIQKQRRHTHTAQSRGRRQEADCRPKRLLGIIKHDDGPLAAWSGLAFWARWLSNRLL